jgi:hypothetical protein
VFSAEDHEGGDDSRDAWRTCVRGHVFEVLAGAKHEKDTRRRARETLHESAIETGQFFDKMNVVPWGLASVAD